jgi:hypothetical protein
VSSFHLLAYIQLLLRYLRASLCRVCRQCNYLHKVRDRLHVGGQHVLLDRILSLAICGTRFCADHFYPDLHTLQERNQIQRKRNCSNGMARVMLVAGLRVYAVVLPWILAPILSSSWSSRSTRIHECGLRCSTPKSNCAISFQWILQTICGLLPQVLSTCLIMFFPLHF